MKHLIFNLLAVAVLAAAPGKQTFAGIITDDVCATADHSQMRMGPTDAECAKACIDAHGASYILYDGKKRLHAERPADAGKIRGTESEGHRHAGRQHQDDPCGLDYRGKMSRAVGRCGSQDLIKKLRHI